MHRMARRLAPGIGATFLAGVLAATAIAAFPDTDVKLYTGCVTSGGSLTYVKEGTAPTQPCSSPKQQVVFSGGDITKVSVTGALTGGGDNGAVTIGLDASKTVPATCSAGQVPKWGAGAWSCGTDNDTTYAAGTGLDLSSNAFSVEPGYRLPQGCASGDVPKGNGSGGWTCAGDSVGSGPSDYFNAHEHVVESYTNWQQVAGFSDLPAGNYVFTTVIYNQSYDTQNGSSSQDLRCHTLLNGQDVTLWRIVPEHDNRSYLWADTVPSGSSFIVECVMVSESGFADDDATLASAQVNALRVGAINP